MGFFRSTGSFVYKTFLDVPGWFGWRIFKSDTKALYSMGKEVLTAERADKKETFEQAKKRLNLTDQDIEKADKYYLKLTVIYVFIGVLCILYTFYLFWINSFLAGFIALLVAFFGFEKAFVSHFYHFQIKHRKLGCSFREWFNGKIEASEE